MKTIDYIENWLSENLSTKRLNHSKGCAQMAKELAQMFNLDSEKAYLAGLVHDCAKNFKDEKLLQIIKEEIKVGFNENELKNPKTYHAIVGVYVAKNEFEIEDNEILQSIRNHTIGSVDMTTFDKIIFLADKIEPNARDEKYSKKVLKLIEKNKGIVGLDLAIFKCFCETIKSLVRRKLYICSSTIDVYNKLQESVGELLDED